MAQEIPVHFKSLPNLNLSFQPATLTKGVGLNLDGQPLKKKRGKYFLPAPNEGEPIKLKAGFDVFAPTFEYGNEKSTPVTPLPMALLILALIPMGLIGIGGLIGGALGGLGWYLNLFFLHTDHPLPVRIAGVLGITGLAYGGCFMIAGAIFTG